MKAALRNAVGGALAMACATVLAQAGKGPQQVVRPPVAQAWIDAATFSGMGMPGMGMQGMGSPMGMLGGLFGGAAKNSFGNTQSASAGQWLDVTLYTRNNPNLAEATQAVPAATQLAPTLALRAPQQARSAPAGDDESVVEADHERPRGKISMYWGCGDAVRAGQPRMLDFAAATPADLQRMFASRRATQRGAHSTPGRPLWPNPDDSRMVPAGASLIGEHAFSGQGVPEGMRFAIGAAQDLMPPIELAQRDAGGATALQWKSLPTARAYFIAVMGGRENEMIVWTSSEVPEFGMGLIDYQTNAAVDRWLGEKVLLAPSVTNCTVPKGIFGEGAMLRMIAYGSELNLAHPPRPADPKVAWEPQWAAKIRVKSVASAMLGMDMGAMMRDAGREEAAPKKEEKKPGAIDILRGILGR